MFNEIIKTKNYSGFDLTLKTGKIATQADGAVMASWGDSVVLAVVAAAKEAKEDQDFFPLTVNYIEKAYAAGKIPGGYVKRETKPSDREVLISRLIDRPIRPLFPSGFKNEVNITCTVMSYDERVPIDILSIIASSAALAISGLPHHDTLAAARIGFDGTNFVLNPSISDNANGNLDLVIAGTKTSILMVESSASELSEDTMLDALAFGQNAMQEIISLIEELKQEVKKEPLHWSKENQDLSKLEKDIYDNFGTQLQAAYWTSSKSARKALLSNLHKDIIAKYEAEFDKKDITNSIDAVEYNLVREQTVKSGIRLDGRKNSDIRNIYTEVGLLPRAHGSALFMRGETQALVATTLGSTTDEQASDSLEGDSKERFMLNYNFPQYSVGETGPLKPPGRREIGHGKLAWRALSAVLPSRSSFPYSIRVVSEITACNGSSSMATICGASLSMMDAGVPLSSPVAGIAMGLVKLSDKYMILSDIISDEDKLGDMDFKVAGTENGITALQMDIKTSGIDFNIMRDALLQAKDARFHILTEMSKTLSDSKMTLSSHAPMIKTMKISKDKIRDLIGPGGKVIKEIGEVSKAKIEIADDGTVSIAGSAPAVEKASAMVSNIALDPEVGSIIDGTVVKIIESGAFIKIGSSKDGFVHISEIAHERISNVSDYLSEGQEIKVKILAVEKGKIKLSIKQLIVNPSSNGNQTTVESKPKSKIIKKKPDYHQEREVENPRAEEMVERKYFS